MSDARTIEGVQLPPAGKYEFDKNHTLIQVTGRHIITRTRGRFEDFDGTITVGDGLDDSGVEIEVKAASVNSNVQMRDDHMRSGDFLNVEEYPVIRFRSTGVRPTGGKTFELDGDLTIKDVTKPITLKAEYFGSQEDPFGNTIFSVSAKTTLAREDWDMTWNMVVESGGLLVSKQFDLEVDVEAHKVG